MNQIERVARDHAPVTEEIRAIAAAEWDHLLNRTFSTPMAVEHLAQFIMAQRTAVIAAMRGEGVEPSGWRYDRKPGAWLPARPYVQLTRWSDYPSEFWTETALYAGPTPPASGKD